MGDETEAVTRDAIRTLLQQMSNGGIKQRSVFRSGATGGVDWLGVLERFGLPVTALLAVSGLLVWGFILPMRDTNAMMIQTNIESQRELTRTVNTMGEELHEQRVFMRGVDEVHAEQIQLLKQIGDKLGD